MSRNFEYPISKAANGGPSENRPRLLICSPAPPYYPTLPALLSFWPIDFDFSEAVSSISRSPDPRPEARSRFYTLESNAGWIPAPPIAQGFRTFFVRRGCDALSDKNSPGAPNAGSTTYFR